MRKLLITSDRFSLTDVSLFKDAIAKSPITGFMRLQAKIYASRAMLAGWDVYVASDYSFYDFKVVPNNQIDFADYDDVIILYCTGNFIGGGLTRPQYGILHGFKTKNVHANIYIYYDDVQCAPANIGTAVWKKVKDGKCGFKVKDAMKDVLTEDIALYIQDYFNGPNTFLLVPGGNLPYPGETRSLGIKSSKQVDDSFQNYYAGRELAGKYLEMDPYPLDQIECDVIYAGNDRKQRMNVLAPIFQSERIKSRSHIRRETNCGYFDDKAATYKNHEDLPLFQYDESAERHSRALIIPVVGDPWQNGNFVSLRWWSTLSYPAIPAIHMSYDPNKVLIKNEYLKQELYWTTEEDMFKLIQKAKDYEYRKKIIALVREEVPSTTWIM